MLLFLVVLLVSSASLAASSEVSPNVQHAKMHVGVLTIPLYGHFMPLKAAGEGLLVRGHSVTLFVENAAWCVTALKQQFGCVVIPTSNRFASDFFVNMSAHPDLGSSFTDLFKEMFLHHEQQLGPLISIVGDIHHRTPFSLFLVDLSTFVGQGIADKFNVPYASMFPLTMHMTVGPASFLPSIGTGFPANGRMPITQRLANYLLKLAVAASSSTVLAEINPVRLAAGIPAMKHSMQVAGLEGLIFSPTIWGYDIAQPLCPNIFGVGILSPTHSHTPMEASLEEFLAKCASKGRRAVYVNFGTLAVLNNETFAALFAGLRMTAHCIVWKISESHRMEIVQSALREQTPSQNLLAMQERFYIVSRFANPVAIMQHRNMGAFVSHCGDTSVLEAIESNLPIAGIPIFADQGDVCRRVDEAAIGIYVGHKLQFSPQRLSDVLDTLVANGGEQYRNNMRRLKKVSDFLGGSEKVADVIESRFRAGLLHGTDLLERCHFLSPELAGVEAGLWRSSQSDVMLLTVAVIVLTVLGIRGCVLWCCCRRSRSHPKTKK